MSVLPRLTIVSALLLAPAAALAQGGPPPGVTWQGGAPGARTVVHHGGPHPGVDVRHHRLQRGHVVPPFWFGPQFHIANWSLYDFPDPGAERRWVRYYDDAYLIDRGGRVMDTRHGLDWDEYGERWDVRDGVPAYHGRNEWHPDDVDYAWAREQGAWEHGPGPQGHAYGPPQGGYGGYGYGYGYAYPIIIETTVTRPVTTYTTEIIEEVVEVRQRPRRRAVRRAAAPRPACNCPAARPAPPAPPAAPPPPPVPAGERG